MKTNNETLRPQEVKVPLYKKAILPWAIIALLAAVSAGLITGWTLRGNQSDQVKAEAASMVDSLSKHQSR